MRSLKIFFESSLQRHQEELEKSMKGSEFVIGVGLLYYKLHKISLNRCGSYIAFSNMADK